ncbi:MAG TPA: 3-phosphoshikimate 1-carboxyvinyltransferase [Holophagaceae bacterium]|nr:3-phosphoshikimate 1-carboxyvinyltransferase [Holophagaceae bacterium]
MPLSLPQDTRAGSPLRSIRIPGSKSVTNRALLLAALAPGSSRLEGGLEAEDTVWMRRALQACGIPVQEAGDAWMVTGGGAPRPTAPLWLGASGTSLRFLLPWLALAATGPVELHGDERLFERPLEPLLRPLASLGARIERTSHGLRVQPAQAPSAPIHLAVDAALSSQFLTGLALALAGSPCGGTLTWTATSSPTYLELTHTWLHRFGCPATLDARQWHLPGGALHPLETRLPGDWSGAAAFYAAAALTGRAITLGPWDPRDPQGDRALLQILAHAGARVSVRTDESGDEHVTLQGPLQRGLTADLESCPDLGPVLAAVAACAPGPSILTGLHTLPLKECDRLDASAELVRWLGGEAEVEGDHTLRIRPGEPPSHRPPFDPRNDHRMAFAAAVGALRHGGELLHPGCVAKTFPHFWEAWAEMLG